jgi:hypothetical protein
MRPLESSWIDCFERVFRLCGVQPGDACAVLAETQTRPELPLLSELALARIGARPFHLVMPARPLSHYGRSKLLAEELVLRERAASIADYCSRFDKWLLAGGGDVPFSPPPA